MRKKGEFTKEKLRHKRRQQLFDKIKTLRERGYCWITHNGIRYKVLAADSTDEWGVALAKVWGEVCVAKYSHRKGGASPHWTRESGPTAEVRHGYDANAEVYGVFVRRPDSQW